MVPTRAFSVCLLFGSLGFASPSPAQITPGNLVVVRVGDGSGSLSNAATASFLDEFTTTGTLVQSLPMPTGVSGMNLPCTVSGSATGEGLLSISSTGDYLITSGYAAAPGTAAVSGTTSAATPRVIARIRLDGTIDTSTSINNLFSGVSVRSAVSTDGANFWVTGGNSGVVYASMASTTGLALSNMAPTNLRVANIANGQLYATTGSGAAGRLLVVGSGVPSTAGQTVTPVPGFPVTTLSPYDIFFAGTNTAYVADDSTVANGGGIQKWALHAGTWTLQYVLSPGTGACRSVSGHVSNGISTLWATTNGSSGSTLVSVTDTGPAAAFITLSTAPAATAFRGVRFVNAPAKLYCTTDHYDSWLTHTVPGYSLARQNLLTNIAARAQQINASPANRFATEFVIPVVVHVVWRTQAERVGLAQIQSQIDALNRDFSASNTDISTVPSMFADVTANTRIRFVLATRDPGCGPTSGFTDNARPTRLYFVANNDVKSSSTGGVDPWPSTQYLNIWVCNLYGAYGYAQFPGGPADTDGIVIDYRCFGTTPNVSAPHNMGRACVHEVGHWLGLRHVFSGFCGGGGAFGDFINDTPEQFSASSGCPIHPQASCTSADMFMNYMDYSDDQCKVMFTLGQALRMEATLAMSRASLQGSMGHIPPSGGSADLWIADDLDDVGNEVNIQSQGFWSSSDIWVRSFNDQQPVHQNPDHSVATNTVYVRVRNRGCTPSAPARLKTYWAKASSGLGWPAPWDDTSTALPDMGNIIGSVTIPSLNPGSSQVFAFPWNPLPNPAEYASFGADRSHFCLLARIETSATAPYGMSFAEADNLYDNVKNNNNIAWRNISILSDGMFRGIGMTANHTAAPQQVRLVVSLSANTTTPLPTASLQLNLASSLLQKWIAGGGHMAGLQRINASNKFRVLQQGAWLGGIALNPGDFETLELVVGPGLATGPKSTTTVRIQQVLEPALTLVGGQDFVLPIGVNFDLGHTSTFGSGCLGSAGIPTNVVSTPTLGAAILDRIGNVPSSLNLFILMVGWTNTVSVFGPLPFDMAGIGAPGCQGRVSPDISILGIGAAGVVDFTLAVPNSPAFISLEVFTQGLVIDPGVNGLGATVSDAVALVVGM